MRSFEYCKKTIKELRNMAISMIDMMNDGVDAERGVRDFVKKPDMV